MDKFLPALILVAIVLLSCLGMWLGWRRRSRTSEAFLIPSPPADDGLVLCTVRARYAGSTEHGRPLERVVAPGLSFRGAAELRVAKRGVTVAVTGERAVFIPREALVDVGRASWNVDTVVESGGLVVLAWVISGEHGTKTIDTHVRLTEPLDADRFLEAVDHLRANPGSGQRKAQV